MMADTWARLANADERLIEDAVIRNALIESMLLHVRNLTEFLVKEPRVSDMARTDFGTSPVWTPEPPDAAARLIDAWDPINKHLSHLTWERISPSPTEWAYMDIARDVVAVFEAWYATVENDPSHEPLRSGIRDAKRLLDHTWMRSATPITSTSTASTWVISPELDGAPQPGREGD